MISALDKINSIFDKKNQSERPKADWFKLEGGESATVRFLNELDPDATNYNEERGEALVTLFHTKPSDWKKSSDCTKESTGQCYPCEMKETNPMKGWAAKAKLSINVLVEKKDGEPKVEILQQKVSDSSIIPSLVAIANKYGTITNRNFEIKRVGAGKDTSYILLPEPEELTEDADVELYDLKEIIPFELDYESQKKFFGEQVEEEEEEEKPAKTAEIDW